MKSLMEPAFNSSLCLESCTLVPSRSINHLRHSPTWAEGDPRKAAINSKPSWLSKVTIMSLCTQADKRF